ncbi:hypothetical protein ACFVQ0_24345 [Streptomyces sp. NPDC057900]|uniref:hypothetical protein n=1 Tax=Streptomyces sp. NPDC057900 TaxID=3346274 RepID=UPI0036E5FCA8
MSAPSTSDPSDPSPEPNSSFEPISEPNLNLELSRQLHSIEAELTKLRKQQRLGQAARMVSLLVAAREALNGTDGEVWAVMARSARQFAKLFDLFDE